MCGTFLNGRFVNFDKKRKMGKKYEMMKKKKTLSFKRELLEKSDCHFVGPFSQCCEPAFYIACKSSRATNFNVSVYFHTCCFPFMPFHPFHCSLFLSLCFLFHAFFSPFYFQYRYGCSLTS